MKTHFRRRSFCSATDAAVNSPSSAPMSLHLLWPVTGPALSLSLSLSRRSRPQTNDDRKGPDRSGAGAWKFHSRFIGTRGNEPYPGTSSAIKFDCVASNSPIWRRIGSLKWFSSIWIAIQIGETSIQREGKWISLGFLKFNSSPTSFHGDKVRIG